MHTRRTEKVKDMVTKQSERWHHKPASTMFSHQPNRCNLKCLDRAQGWACQERLPWPTVILDPWEWRPRRHQISARPCLTKTSPLIDLFPLLHLRSTPHPLDCQHVPRHLKLGMAARIRSHRLASRSLPMVLLEVRPKSHRASNSQPMAVIGDSLS